MVNLKQWAKNHQTYLKVLEGEPVTCKFLGAEDFVDKENKDQDKIRYFLEVDGAEKVMESQSIGLAEIMAAFVKGDWIKISRTGQQRATRYTVEKIEAARKKV